MGQERLLGIYFLHPDYCHHTDVLLRLNGAIDVEAFKWGLGAVVSRHEALRSTFRYSAGIARQRVWPTMTFPFDVVDVADLAPGEAAETAWDSVLGAAGEYVARPFDLKRGPLLRARLIRLSDREAALHIVIHHIVSDGWSLGVLLRELSAFYAGRVQGTAAQLEPLPVQYAEYAIWQREWLSGDRLDVMLQYWHGQLNGAPQIFSLPADKPRPAVQSFRGTTAGRVLPAELVAGLRELASTEDSTLFMILLSVTGCLLGRWSEQSELLIATTVANRGRREFESLIGFFVNTLIIRIDLSGGPDFRTVLRRVRETSLSALEHQDTPFDQVVNAMRPERDLSRQPLAQVLFTMQNFAIGLPQFPGLETQRLNVPAGNVQYDLTLSADEDPAGLLLNLTCSADLFAADTGERLLAQLEMLAGEVASSPDTPVALLPMLPADERRLVVQEWNSTAAPYPAGRCLHDLVEEHAGRSPDAVAVVSQADVLTYAELDEQANRLAWRLQRQGVGPERIAAICLRRSASLVVAMLAVLKAGGAAVILDPQYPASRLAFMTSDSEAAVLISDNSLRDRLPSSVPPVLLVDSPRDSLAKVPPTRPDSAVTDENIAYVIYTSGSTGTPKGVAVTHRSVCNLVSWMTRAHQWDSGRVLAHLVSLGFDAAVRDLFVPLSSGGRVVLPSSDDVFDKGRLVDLMELYGVNVIHGVPSLIQALLSDSDDRPVGVRSICCGGEALPLRLLEQCRIRDISLVNLYGPTEATIDASSFSCDGIEAGEVAVPIGSPISNVQMYVLDQGFQPVPIGMTGEIFIGGLGVARGYLRRPGLTAQRFLPCPFAGRRGERMYRTGDLARWRSDGKLEFLGRLDHQVKIRGFRVEPGEIEAVLAQHSQVRGCVVIAADDHDHPGTEVRLIAYLVPAGAEPPAVSQLREYVSERLPGYMVPALFVPLAEFPLTPHGKLDRAALPAPPAVRPELDVHYSAPHTPTGRVLADIWTELLGLDRAGIHDNFFELGGHSLLAMRMVLRISSVYNLSLPPTLPFLCRTINGIEQVISEQKAEEELSHIAASYFQAAGGRTSRQQDYE
jgi:amino acid adenylation domain-containing protein